MMIADRKTNPSSRTQLQCAQIARGIKLRNAGLGYLVDFRAACPDILHKGLASACSNVGYSLCHVFRSAKIHRFLQLRKLCRDQRVNGSDPLGLIRYWGRAGLEMPQNLRNCRGGAIVGLQISVLPGQQKPALTGFRIRHLYKQLRVELLNIPRHAELHNPAPGMGGIEIG
jgi:hypothetical protein